MNWCCIPQEKKQQQNIYLTAAYDLPQQSQKQKFSFRNNASKSVSHSQVSRSSNYLSQEQELQALEREYQLLKEEEKIVDDFQRYRIAQLQQEVAFYQHQLFQRTKQIEQLNGLFRAKLQERRIPVQTGAYFRPQKRRLPAVDQTSNSTQP